MPLGFKKVLKNYVHRIVRKHSSFFYMKWPHKNTVYDQAMVAHASNLSTLEAEIGGIFFVSSRSVGAKQ